MSGERLVRVLLRLFPASFRERYGEEIVEFHRLRQDRIAPGRLARARSWLVVVADLLEAALGERLERRAPRAAAHRKHSPSRTHRMDRIVYEFRIVLRGLWRAKAFALTALLTLAIGIGANAAIFSVLEGVLLAPLPFRESDRMVDFRHQDPYSSVSEPEFMDYRREMRTLSGLGAYAESDASLTGGDAPERVKVLRVSDRFTEVLGLGPILGRSFGPDEEAAGSGPSPVVMIGAGLWKRYYAMDSAIVGKSIQLNGVARTVIGVMPQLEYPGSGASVWLPLRLNRDSLWTRNNHYLRMVGRLAPAATVAQASSEANVLARRWATDFPGTYFPNQPLVAVVRSAKDRITGGVRPYLFALLGGAGFVLLIVCVNVANLMLARGETRRRELSIRTALGASHGRLVRQLLLESVVLAGLGGILGLLVAGAAIKALVAAAPGTVPRLDQIGVDLPVLAFTFLLSAVTGLLFGVLPAIRAGRSESMEVLRQGGRRAGGQMRRGARAALVTAQIALAVTMLVGAGLLMRSLRSLQTVDPGFDPENVLTAKVSLPPPSYTDEQTVAFVDQVEQRLRAVPGVRGIAAMGWTPVVDGGSSWSIWVDGREVKEISEAPSATPQQVSPEYFKVMGIRILRGRSFEAKDRADALPVVIVNQTMVDQLWPKVDPIGRTIKMFGTSNPWVTVVGVSADIRSSGVDQSTPPTMYFPYAQAGKNAYFTPKTMTFAVRTEGDPVAFTPILRTAVRELDSGAPISEIQTMEKALGSSYAGREFTTFLLGAFSGLALLLAGIGIYGVVAYGVSQRTFEIGLRMALGAERRSVMQLVVVSEGVRLIGIGLLIGLGGSIAVGRAIRSLLIGVAPLDPVTIGAVVVTLGLVGLLALAVPASRATSVSPTEALRGD